MTHKQTLSIVLILLFIPFLTACGGANGGNLPAALENRPDEISIDVDLPTLASAEQVEELQVTVEALSESVSELTEEGVAEVVEQAEAIATQIPAPETAPEVVQVEVQVSEANFQADVVDENGQVSVTITQDQVNQALALAAQNNQGNVVSGTSIRFTGGLIIFEADVTQPITGRLYIAFVPYVSNGTLQFDAVEASLDGNRVPPAALNTAEATLNATLADSLNQLPSDATLTEIIVGEGFMTLIGQR